MRAEAQSAGLADLEEQLRERIRAALPIRRIGPEVIAAVPKPSGTVPDDEGASARRAPPAPVRTKSAQLATLPAVQGRRSERRVLNLPADLREEGATVAQVEIANISEHGFLIHDNSGLELEVGSFAWLKLAGFEPFKTQVVRLAGGKLGGRFLTPLYPAVLELILKEEPQPKRRRLFHPPRPSAAA